MTLWKGENMHFLYKQNNKISQISKPLKGKLQKNPKNTTSVTIIKFRIIRWGSVLRFFGNGGRIIKFKYQSQAQNWSFHSFLYISVWEDYNSND